MFVVEITNERSTTGHVERVECRSAEAAGIEVEERTLLDADEVAELLEAGVPVAERGVKEDCFVTAYQPEAVAA